MLNFYQLEQSIEATMHDSHIPGLALAVVHECKLIYARGFGVTSVEDGGKPVTPETLFRIGSVTKPLTGTAIMRLVEAGKLDLDTPVKAYIDWFRLSDPDATEYVTLRMLLSHTSGLPTDGQHFGSRDPQGLEVSVREQIPAYALLAPPNTIMSYSNPGLNLAGYIAEVASGKHYAELMQEAVFEPLQMHRTTFDPTRAMTYPLAQSHDLDKDGKLHVQHQYADNVAHYPSGFAISTVVDLANFAMMHMQQGLFQGQRMLTPESVREMHRPQASLYTPDDSAYGLTFHVKTCKGMQQVGHDGGISTFGSRLAMFPEKGTAVIMTFNRWLPTVDTVTEYIFDSLLNLPEQQPEPQMIEPDRSFWSNYCGTYLGQWRGLAKIEAEDDHLVLKQNDTIIPLQAMRNDLYIGHSADDKTLIPVGFPPSAGLTPSIYVNSFVHKREELTTTPDPGRWNSYEGIFALEGLDTYTVRIVDDELRIYSKNDNLESVLTPVDATRFGCSWGIFEFLIADKGNINAVKQGPSWIFERVPLD
ncbi:MAG TPA: serine hydrolase domain-containing protein [Ktedonobacteraceae bacterium]|nr:serine hydrolase domain-containing protein [Ktedonobacteraceae bacterium]